MNELIAGIEKTINTTVSEGMLAVNVRSGGLRVLATPALAALMEQAAFELLEPYMAEGITTVGTMITVEHLNATAYGREISATAKLIDIQDRKYTFEITANDSSGMIARGRHERFSVKTERFMVKTNNRS